MLNYLRDNAYKTDIVTGGGQDFARVHAEKVFAGFDPPIESGQCLSMQGGSGTRRSRRALGLWHKDQEAPDFRQGNARANSCLAALQDSKVHLPRYATCHTFGTQRYRARASHRIVVFFEAAA